MFSRRKKNKRKLFLNKLFGLFELVVREGKWLKLGAMQMHLLGSACNILNKSNKLLFSLFTNEYRAYLSFPSLLPKNKDEASIKIMHIRTWLYARV
jgi:hypothetical protein